jgi:magnesium chelatase family protein
MSPSAARRSTLAVSPIEPIESAALSRRQTENAPLSANRCRSSHRRPRRKVPAFLDYSPHCAIDDASRDLLENVMTAQNFSARAHDRILKVARTIADLAHAPDITADHLLEAVGFRTLDRNLWV